MRKGLSICSCAMLTLLLLYWPSSGLSNQQSKLNSPRLNTRIGFVDVVKNGNSMVYRLEICLRSDDISKDSRDTILEIRFPNSKPDDIGWSADPMLANKRRTIWNVGSVPTRREFVLFCDVLTSQPVDLEIELEDDGGPYGKTRLQIASWHNRPLYFDKSTETD